MLEHIKGRVAALTEDAVVLEVGGVGLRVSMATSGLARLPEVGADATVHTVMQIRDETVHLYGFATNRERDMFRALVSVNKVGPKLALAVLSFHEPDALERAVAGGDTGAIALVPGVGAKTAERIVLELKDKLDSPVASAPEATSAVAEVRDGLKGLGYTADEIQAAIAELPPDGDAPTLLRHALRALGAAEASPAGARSNGRGGRSR